MIKIYIIKHNINDKNKFYFFDLLYLLIKTGNIKSLFIIGLLDKYNLPPTSIFLKLSDKVLILLLNKFKSPLILIFPKLSGNHLIF